jgi:hypothetical protein
MLQLFTTVILNSKSTNPIDRQLNSLVPGPLLAKSSQILVPFLHYGEIFGPFVVHFPHPS